MKPPATTEERMSSRLAELEAARTTIVDEIMRIDAALARSKAEASSRMSPGEYRAHLDRRARLVDHKRIATFRLAELKPELHRLRDEANIAQNALKRGGAAHSEGAPPKP